MWHESLVQTYLAVSSYDSNNTALKNIHRVRLDARVKRDAWPYHGGFCVLHEWQVVMRANNNPVHVLRF